METNRGRTLMCSVRSRSDLPLIGATGTYERRAT